MLIQAKVFLATMFAMFAFVASGFSQSLVEYPGHQQTYGDHSVNTTWAGGPTGIDVSLETDENILHDDGIGQSQRTARNTLTFDGTRSPGNPQNYDNDDLVLRYGDRMPQLQQMSADGVSTLVYDFQASVVDGLDLFITDVDKSDSVVVRAFDVASLPIDMTNCSLHAEGDLSLFKNTGSDFSDIIAPNPITTLATDSISLVAVNDINYNRSFSIIRFPKGLSVKRIEIEFTGFQNSPNRDSPNTGAHIYVVVVTGEAFVPVPSYTVFRGVELVGSVELMQRSDDEYAIFNPGFTLSPNESPVWIVFSGNASRASEFLIESNAGTPGLELTVEARNWASGNFETIGAGAAEFNNDSVATFAINQNLYVAADGDVEARAGWRRIGFTINFPWEVRIDQAGWLQ